MPAICDHTSVGMLVWKDNSLLLIERKRFPFGFAPPAGHVDVHGSFEQAAKNELKEEVGLEVENLKLLTEGKKENLCRRESGTWHYWKIYEAEATGEVKGAEDETKQAGFRAKGDLLALAAKTEQYLRGKISENEWEKSPGLEPVWYEWFKELKVI